MISKYEILNLERRKENEKKLVAVYCRVSTDDDDQANSFESQQRYFRQYIENHPDWELYDIYADEGISGTSTKKRKEFNRMIADAMLGKFDLIITKEISRFARNTLDSIYYTRELKKYGVGVIFANDNINTLDGDAELRLTIMASIAQEESRRTSERVKWGQKRQMEQGVVFGRDMLGYDVKDGKLSINEDGAKIVRMIFKKFVEEGKGTHVIARELREAGIKPLRIDRWSNTVILRVLRNEKYCGDLVQKKTITPDFLSHAKKYNRGEEEFVIIKDHHEPIISRETFEAAAKILEERAISQEGRAKYSNRYPFSGKIKCAICGSSYVARYKKRKDGSIYKRWICYEATTNGFPHTDADGNAVGCYTQSMRNEDAVYIMYLVTKSLSYNKDKIISRLLDVISQVIHSTSPVSLDELTAKEAAITQKRERLIELYMNNMITRDEFASMRNKNDEEMKAVELEIAALNRRNDMVQEREKLIGDITDAINEIISGVQYEDDFYSAILQKMVVYDTSNVDVYLNLLPFKWRYTLSAATKKDTSKMQSITDVSGVKDIILESDDLGVSYGTPKKRDISDDDIPISVRSPLSSSKGME